MLDLLFHLLVVFPWCFSNLCAPKWRKNYALPCGVVAPARSPPFVGSVRSACRPTRLTSPLAWTFLLPQRRRMAGWMAAAAAVTMWTTNPTCISMTETLKTPKPECPRFDGCLSTVFVSVIQRCYLNFQIRP